MGKMKLLIIPVILLVTMACGLTNGIQQIQNMTTQLPGDINAVETAAAGVGSLSCGTPTPGTMKINLANARAVLQITGMVTFTDGTVDGKAETTITLTSTGANAYPAIATGSSVEFVGDSCAITLVHVVIPRTNDQATVDQGLALLNLTLAASMPLDVQIPLLSWLNDNYANLAVGGQTDTTLSNIKFTMQRNDTQMLLEAVPAQ